MREFLKYEHYLDIEALPREDASAELRRMVRSTLGELNRRTGHFTEIIVAGVMNNFDDRNVDGKTYFNGPTRVNLLRMKNILRCEGVVKEGEMKEIDIIGEFHYIMVRRTMQG